MWFTRFTNHILANRWLAIVLAFVTTIIPLPGGSLGSLIAVLVTLRKGAYQGSEVFFAVLAASILNIMLGQAGSQIIFFLAITLIFVVNLLTWLSAFLLQRTNSWQMVIEIGALCGIVGVIMLHFIFPHLMDWWVAELTILFNKPHMTMYSAQLFSTMDAAQQKLFIIKMSQYATGFVGVSVLLSAWSQTLIGRWWQAIVFNPGGLRKEFYAIRLSKMAVVLLGALFILAKMHVIGVDSLLIGIFAFVIAGFSLFHAIFGPLKKGWFILGLIYLTTLVTFPISLIVIALIALFDALVDFRGRLKSRTN